MISCSWVRGRKQGGRRRRVEGGDVEGRSTHSSLGCNWISAARAGRMFSSRSPCRGVLARSSFPASPILSRLAQLMGYFLPRFLCSPSVIFMSEHVEAQVSDRPGDAAVESLLETLFSAAVDLWPWQQLRWAVAAVQQRTCSVPVLQLTTQTMKDIHLCFPKKFSRTAQWTHSLVLLFKGIFPLER